MIEGIYYDWIAITLAAVSYVLIGFLWHSQWLFGPCWKKSSVAVEPKPLPFAWLWESASAFLIAFFLAFFNGYLGVTTVTDGMFIGFCLWLGFVAPTQFAGVIWGGFPFSRFCIVTSHRLLALLVMGGLLGA